MSRDDAPNYRGVEWHPSCLSCDNFTHGYRAFDDYCGKYRHAIYDSYEHICDDYVGKDGYEEDV